MAGVRRLGVNVTIIGCLSAAAAVAPRAQDPIPPNQPAPTFRAGVNVVRVDAVVTDKNGKPILDLTADDFEIAEGGKRQQIDTFKLVSQDVRLAGTDTSSPDRTNSRIVDEEEAARDEVRLFAIFLDDYHVQASMRQIVSQQVSRFVERELAPGDVVGVMHPTDLLAEVRFTSDHDRISRDIRQFGQKPTSGKYPFNERFENVNPAVAADIKLDVSFDAIKALIMRMGSLKEGRKGLIIVSDGYRGDWATLRGKLGKISELANRHNTALYPVNPRFLPPLTPATIADDAFRLLAEGSGGRPIFDRAASLEEFRASRRLVVPSSHMATVMKQIVADLNGYYLLGYRSTLAVPDGKYHKIDLKVKRRGVEVRYRKGYWASTAADLTPRIIPPSSDDGHVLAAIAALTTPRVFPIRTWIGTELGDSGMTRIRFSWDATPATPGDGAGAADRPAKVTLEAARPGGDTYYSGEVRSSVAFDAPPGAVQLRVMVESQGLEVLDRIVRNITATDFTVSGLLVGTPQVYRARSAAEAQRLRDATDASPAATREFSRTERLLIRVPAYGPAGTEVRVRAVLVGRTGQTLAELPVSAALAAGYPSIELTLASLAPGAYAIRITAAADTQSAEEIVAFRVTN